MKFKEYINKDKPELAESLSGIFTRVKRKLITKIYKKSPELKKFEKTLEDLLNDVKRLEQNLSPADRKWAKGLSLDTDSIVKSLTSSITDDVVADIQKEFDLIPKNK